MSSQTPPQIPKPISKQIPVSTPVDGCVSTEPYALQVLNDDCVPAIPRGSVVIIEPARRARLGQFVLVYRDEALSIRQFQPADDVQGVVVSVRRPGERRPQLLPEVDD